MFFTAIYFFYPIRHLRIEAEFLVKYKGFEQIVMMVQTGEIESNQDGEAILPRAYKDLAVDGKVRYYKENGNLYINFATNNAILDQKCHF